jgi:hypothetical protein
LKQLSKKVMSAIKFAHVADKSDRRWVASNSAPPHLLDAGHLQIDQLGKEMAKKSTPRPKSYPR